MTLEIRLVAESRPLNEQLWEEWVARGQAADERGRELRLKALKLAAIGGLLFAAVPWPHAAFLDAVVRFVIAAAAIAVMASCLVAGRYFSAALFAALAVLLNPIVPVFEFAGDWRRALLVACAVPFAVSLRGRNANVEASHD